MRLDDWTFSLIASLIAGLVVGCTQQSDAGPVVQCQISGEGSPADSVHARETCAEAVSRFSELLGEAAPMVGIHLTDADFFMFEIDTIGPGWLVVPTRERQWKAEATMGGDVNWNWFMPHELGHLLLIMAVLEHRGIEVRNSSESSYGTVLPDWFDESVAIWTEPEPSRAERIQQARGLADAAPDLTEFARVRHPHAGRIGSSEVVARSSETRTIGPCVGRCPGRSGDEPRGRRIERRLYRSGLVVIDTVFFDPDAQPREEHDSVLAFYAFSAAALTFIHEEGGAPAVRALWERLRAEPKDTMALLSLPGLPAGSDALNEAWHGWLRRPEP